MHIHSTAPVKPFPASTPLPPVLAPRLRQTLMSRERRFWPALSAAKRRRLRWWHEQGTPPKALVAAMNIVAVQAGWIDPLVTREHVAVILTGEQQ